MALASSSEPDHTSSSSPKRLTIKSIQSLMTLCAKQASRVSDKLKATATKTNDSHRHHHADHDRDKRPKVASRKSPLRRPKELLTQISYRATAFIHSSKSHNTKGEDGINVVQPEPGEYGDGGVWQKAILMGDKCQPLDFPGGIYYDSYGKQVDELPIRSPRASPLPGYLTRAN